MAELELKEWVAMGSDEARDACVSIVEAVQVIYWGGRRGRPIGESFNYLAAGLRDSVWRRRRYTRTKKPSILEEYRGTAFDGIPVQ